MYIKRSGLTNYMEPVDLRTLYTPEASGVEDSERAPKSKLFKDIYYPKTTQATDQPGQIEAVGESFARHSMLHGAITMTELERLERRAAFCGGYRQIDGIERHHHRPRPGNL